MDFWIDSRLIIYCFYTIRLQCLIYIIKLQLTLTDPTDFKSLKKITTEGSQYTMSNIRPRAKKICSEQVMSDG